MRDSLINTFDVRKINFMSEEVGSFQGRTAEKNMNTINKWVNKRFTAIPIHWKSIIRMVIILFPRETTINKFLPTISEKTYSRFKCSRICHTDNR